MNTEQVQLATHLHSKLHMSAKETERLRRRLNKTIEGFTEEEREEYEKRTNAQKLHWEWLES
jgi:hypothetical protein